MPPIWTVAPVSEQPRLTLIRWRVFETELGERHFVGYCRENRNGRVSSAIETLDPSTRRATTRSGRVYQLVGPPGNDPEGWATWPLWAYRNEVESFRDVSDEVFAMISEPTH